MGSKKLRIHNTQLDNLVSNLRGEVGEIISSWYLMRTMLRLFRARQSEIGNDDHSDQQLNTYWALTDKLEDEIVARLSELAEPKVGRLTFFFASQKLGVLEEETRAFQNFIASNRFTQKRNQDISHKELPEKWSDRRHIHISYTSIARGIAMAIRLMKRIDLVAEGPEARFFWKDLRRHRGDLELPPRVQYMLAPYCMLSEVQRFAVIEEDSKQGKHVWEPMRTLVNGQDTAVLVCKKWGAILLGNRIVFVPDYPLNSLTSINFGPGSPGSEGAPPEPSGA